MRLEKDIKQNQLRRKLKREAEKRKVKRRVIALSIVGTLTISLTYMWGFMERNAKADTARILSTEETTEINTEEISAEKKVEKYSDKTYSFKKVKTDSDAYTRVSNDAKVALNLKDGEYVEYKGTENGWSKIKHRDIVAYIEQEQLEDTSENELKVVDGVLIVTKDYSIPEDFYGKFDIETENAMMVMFEAMRREGLSVSVSHTYINSNQNLEEINMEGAQSPDINHHELRTGRAIRLTKKGFNDANFADTEESKWLKENSFKYGFVQRYPEGKSDITGYSANDLIYSYVGSENAKNMHMKGLTIEEYFE